MRRINLFLSQELRDAALGHAKGSGTERSTHELPALINLGAAIVLDLAREDLQNIKALREMLSANYALIKGTDGPSLAVYLDVIDKTLLRNAMIILSFTPKSRAIRMLLTVGLAYRIELSLLTYLPLQRLLADIRSVGNAGAGRDLLLAGK